MTVPFVYVFFLPSACSPTEAEVLDCPEGTICMALVFDTGIAVPVCRPLEG